MITHLVSPEALAASETEVEGDGYRHLFRARRVAVGDRLRLTDGRGGARWAEVAAVDRRSARLVLGEEAPTFEPALRLELLVAPPRRERASWLVEKATELGVAAVRFLAAERSPREPGSGTLARLERVAAAALEQCHGARLPEISGVHPSGELRDLLAPHAVRLWLDPPAGAALSEAARERVTGSAALLVGPEGGWSDDERERFAAAGARAVRLGDRVLRIETAAVAGAALLLS